MINAKRVEYLDTHQQVKPVDCVCGHWICDSAGIIRSRCVKIHEGTALCRCKRWLKVPIEGAINDD